MRQLKNKIKTSKLIALLITCVTIMTSVVLPISAKSSNRSFEEQFKILSGLHLVSADEDTAPATEITRGRFAKEVTHFLGVKVDNTANQYYYDVEKDHKYASYINYVKEYGYMVGGNGYFRPEAPIKKIEVLRTIISALGYDQIAQYYGGYKQGYLKVASDLGIAMGNSDDEAKYSDLVQIFYEAMNSEVVSVGFVNGEIRNTQTEVNFLEKFHGLTERKGRVVGTYSTAIDGLDETGEKSIRIDGIEYELKDETLPINDYLGYYVNFWYNKDNEIVYFINDDTEELVISAGEIEKYNDGELSYFIGEKIKRAQISKHASIIYNGSDVLDEGYTDDIFDISHGEIELLKYKGSSDYDVVKIFEYENYVVSSASPKNSRIYIKNRDKVVNLYDYKKYYLRGAVGEAKQLDTISTNNILSIAENRDKTIAYIVISDKSVVGNISSVGTNEKGEASVIINGEEFVLDNDFELNCDVNISTGMEIEAYLDYKGKLVFAKYSANTLDWKYGFMTKMYGDENESGIRIYTQDGEFKTFALPDKVSLDGERMLSEVAVRELEEKGGGSVKPQLIKYISIGETVTKIDTAKPVNSEPYKKNLSLYVDTKLRFANENQRFHYYGSDFAWNNYFTALKADDNTIVFIVPESAEEQRKNEKLYSMAKGYSYFWRPKEPIYNIAAYDVDEENGDVAKVIVVKGGIENEYRDTILVNSIETKVNSSDEIVTVLNGFSYEAQANKSWELEDGVQYFYGYINKTANNGAGLSEEEFKIPIKSLKRGDIVNIGMSSNGKVAKIRRKFGLSHLGTSMEVLDESGNITNRTASGTFIQKHGVISIGGIHIGSGGGSELTEMIGVITDRNGKYLHYANINPKTDTVEGKGKITLEINGFQIFHYSSKRDKIEVLSQDDIDEYIYSSNKQAICYVITCFTNLRCMVIYD